MAINEPVGSGTNRMLGFCWTSHILFILQVPVLRDGEKNRGKQGPTEGVRESPIVKD